MDRVKKLDQALESINQFLDHDVNFVVMPTLDNGDHLDQMNEALRRLEIISKEINNRVVH